MRTDLFLKMMDEEFASVAKLFELKNADYSGTEAGKQIKDTAETLGVTPEIVWAVYAGKHWSAIQTYCKDGEVKSEPIEGRIQDVIVYCLLLLSFIKDSEKAQALIDIDHADDDD